LPTIYKSFHSGPEGIVPGDDRPSVCVEAFNGLLPKAKAVYQEPATGLKWQKFGMGRPDIGMYILIGHKIAGPDKKKMASHKFT
jgi:hypothetical protein